MASSTKQTTTHHLKALYATYRGTADIDAKGAFFSPECIQICRPQPAYAATNRQTIVRYLHEAASTGKNLATGGQIKTDREIKKGATIRPLTDDEFEFATDDVTAPAGFTSSALKRKAELEDWVGMRVDMWDGDDGTGSTSGGLLVKVQYWWRKEGEEWVQILHDIMHMGPLEGTEGSEGELL
ncbi:hypothetical protein B0T22DRAFT_416073 [Podospora appendiculata]|uniref:SnoaL-like domain-containing protein n=1 Tax=Podospora appendiculata TaxID=314037 RepID=A0AAE1CF23_9PEZI|nr:hypothetical protein B0T22DRAFT_416073 [Podospora appendiculata]